MVAPESRPQEMVACLQSMAFVHIDPCGQLRGVGLGHVVEIGVGGVRVRCVGSGLVVLEQLSNMLLYFWRYVILFST